MSLYYAILPSRRRRRDPVSPVQAQDFSTTDQQTGDIISKQVKSLKQKVGEVEQATSYATAAELAKDSKKRNTSSLVAGFNIPEYPMADMLIEELLRPRGIGQLERGS